MVKMDFQADLPRRVYSVLRLKMNIATNAPIAGPSPWQAMREFEVQSSFQLKETC